MTRAWVAAALAVSAAAAIAATRGSTRPPVWKFTARVMGIPVTALDGRAMYAPFLGGFDVPRPQLVDLNGDGKPELVVQERTGELMVFERVGDEWQWRTDRYQDINVGEWYRFVDGAQGGTLRLFAEMPNGYIRVWRNEGTRTEPKFVALGDTVRDVDGRAIVADRQNILNAVDIDCNGKLDLFIGRVQGVVDRYEQEGDSPDGSPRFRLLEESWQGIEVLGPEVTGIPPHGGQAHASSVMSRHLHGANTLAFANVSGRADGVFDLFWGDFFEEGLLRFENTGPCAQPNLTGKPVRFPPGNPVRTSGYNAATFGDVDGDGNVDLVMGVIGGAYGPSRTSIENLYYVQQAPKGEWAVKTKRLVFTIDVGTDAMPAFGDVNGDGLLDLIIGSKVSPSDPNTGTLTWFENVGTATSPAFRERGVLAIKGQFSYAPAIVDLDGDGLPDLVLGNWTDRLQWYRNTGTRTSPAWTLADSALVTISRGTNTTPAFGDLDGDGLVDLIVGKAAGTVALYKNIGTKTSPKFQLVSDRLQDIKVNRRSAPVLADVDGDGILDLLIGAEDGEVQLWRGVKGELRFERDMTFVLKSYSNASPAVADLRRAGRPDIFVGTGSGGIRWFSNEGR